MRRYVRCVPSLSGRKGPRRLESVMVAIDAPLKPGKSSLVVGRTGALAASMLGCGYSTGKDRVQSRSGVKFG
jgi:hypothetical protein